MVSNLYGRFCLNVRTLETVEFGTGSFEFAGVARLTPSSSYISSSHIRGIQKLSRAVPEKRVLP